MKKEGIIFGASLFAIAFSFNANAQTCNVPPTCEALGYRLSATDCPSGGIKCPFDTTKMYCIESCTYGSVLYSDKTCSKKFVPGKTPIAVVVEPFARLAVALKKLPNVLQWGSNNTPNAQTNSVTGLGACAFVTACPGSGKKNTAIIKAFGEQHKLYYPAVDAVLAYATMGTHKGDWFLPSMQQLKFLRDNEPTITITTDMLAAKGVDVENVYDGYWSSNETNVPSEAWYLGLINENFKKSLAGKVRPMMHY